MELDASLSWLALALTFGLACRLSARLLRKFGSPDRIFHASLTELESCSLPALVAQAIVNKDAFKRAEKELAAIRNIPGCRLINWTEPEYPQTLLQIYDPPVLFYLRGDPQILNLPCLSIVGTRRPTLYGSQMAERLGRDLAARGLAILSGMARGGSTRLDIRVPWPPMAAPSGCLARASTSAIRKRTRSCTKKFWNGAPS